MNIRVKRKEYFMRAKGVLTNDQNGNSKTLKRTPEIRCALDDINSGLNLQEKALVNLNTR